MFVKELEPEKLKTLPMDVLRNLDIKSKEEEHILQAEVNRRISANPQQFRPLTFSNDVTDNFGKPGYPTEAEAQAKIDAKNEEYRQSLEASNPTITDTVEAAPVDELEAKIETMKEEAKTLEQELKFCEFCDSKGVRHKKVCTRPLT